jgi:hypothetical protein
LSKVDYLGEEEKGSLSEADKNQIKQNRIALIVSSFTTTFYGEKKDGKTLYGHNL